MRYVLLAVVLTILAVLPLRAQETIEGVIRSQIEAFQRDDFATAFTFASPVIQGMFGNPDNFGAMVRQGYPMVYRPAEVTFDAQVERGERTYQRVILRDAQGAYHAAEYEMVRNQSGWKINGVQVLKLPDVGA
jgi:hypothetical protein